MFLTLRSSGGGRAGGGMEVVRRNFGPGVVKDRARAARRPACLACQTKKLRCTGSNPRNCDRCRSRLIECVLPSSSPRDRPRTASSHSPQPSSSSTGRPWQDGGDVSPRPRDPPGEGLNGADQGSATSSQQAAITAPRAHLGVDPLADTDFFETEFAFVDLADQAWAAGLTTSTTAVDLMDGRDMDMEDFDRHGAPGEARPSMSSSLKSGRNDRQHPDRSHRNSYDPLGVSLTGSIVQTKGSVSQAQTRPMPDTTAQELPGILALDTALLSSAPSQALPHPPNPNRPGSPPCSCLTDLVRVVQQLDDDEFHITTMSLDQVLRLQKWLFFQCCKPFDCPKCLDLSTVHTMRLILCDRLTEMFECIHLRIRRAGAVLTGQGSDSSSQATSTPLTDSSSAQSHSSLGGAPSLTAAVGSGPLPAQLFCGSSGRAANTAACNPLMFSDEFRNQYSDEEQVHMIRVLLRLQNRNFYMLLSRVERTSQIAASPARQTKVRSMIVRLGKASADIEGALRIVFQALSIG
ncbi:hypothetical protein QBC40DRAFT_231337 [Triangularia verruculosa]|uniref:Zn(2)-C6 fungal-type domain-containing protein n=1 Tax=Triangularia verruculosa TaxID=2587418 RepID=A0AAN6XBX9_9PEZI|nr:hypothetical protein QBC40DRAFT_231337 [Triangularia verruculosa]